MLRDTTLARSSQVFTLPEQFVPRVTDPKELEARFQQVCGHGWKKKDIDGDFLFFSLQSLVKIGLKLVFLSVSETSQIAPDCSIMFLLFQNFPGEHAPWTPYIAPAFG